MQQIIDQSEALTKTNINRVHYNTCKERFGNCLPCAIADVFMTRSLGKNIKYSIWAVNQYFKEE